ncbi:MAG: DUF1214 domain-containing protein [Thermodesulfobacteriota bacterium]
MRRFARSFVLTSVVTLAVGAGAPTVPCTTAAGEAHAASSGQGAPIADAQAEDVVATTFAYVVQLYPLWFSYWQSRIVPINRLAGPDEISPIYHIVVAINDDTLYASSLVDLHDEPVVVTIPPTTASYSILTLDAYGDVFETGMVAGAPGTYALTGPGWTGTLPAGLTPIAMPVDYSILIFRADKYSASGVDETEQANAFRESLRILPLSDYESDPTGGATTIFPQVYFAAPFKQTADNLVAYDPIRFLKMLQTAVASSNTPPMSTDEQALSDRFDALFGDGDLAPDEVGKIAQLAEGTRTAHAAIIDRYLSHTGPTSWISFTNIGRWGDAVIERSAIAEYIQYGNGYETAAYYHTFEDRQGTALDGGSHAYVLTFPAGMLPEASRFWSITAYTPDAIELVWNVAKKYVVASYTPGLTFNADGSLSVHLSAEPPHGVPLANWLPVPRGPFNVMLRVYGPEGSVANATYVPPAVERARRRLIPIRR